MDTIGAQAFVDRLDRYRDAHGPQWEAPQVLRDICRADGPPASQPELARLPGQEREVNIFLREATRRLREAFKPGQRTRQPSRAEAATWVGVAAYLAARLQVSEEEVAHVPGHEGRKADMSPAAGAAMRAVLAEMGKANYPTLTRTLTVNPNPMP